MWGHCLLVWFPVSLIWKDMVGIGREKSNQIKGSLSRTANLALRTLDEGQLGRLYFLSLFLLLQHPSPPSHHFFCSISVKMSPWNYPVRGFLGLLFAYVVAVVAETLNSPDLSAKTCCLFRVGKTCNIRYCRFQRTYGVPGSRDRIVESASFHHCCFDLSLTLFTRTGSRQISEESGPFILKFLFLENHAFNFMSFYLNLLSRITSVGKAA